MNAASCSRPADLQADIYRSWISGTSSPEAGMSTEETELEMKGPEEDQVSDLKDPKDPDHQAAADPDATEADVSQADLDQEKQPMTGAPCAGEQEEKEEKKEKNGSVEVKMLEETEEKFTGLNKEELLRVAGTPG